MTLEQYQTEENGRSAVRKEECETTQSDYTPRPSPPTLPELHNDLLLNILSYLPYTDLTQTRLVCRRWMECVAFKRFARKFCLRIKEDNVKDICKQLQTGCFASGMCYRHMTYMGTTQLDNLKCILHKIGHHIRSLKLRALFPDNSLYALFPNLERLTLEDLYAFPVVLPFELNTFPNLKSVNFVDDSVRQSSSEASITGCLRKNTKLELEELSIRVYAEHVELFLQVLRDHALTLKSLHVVYFDGSANEPSEIVEKWLQTFEQLKKLEKLKIYASNALIFEGTLHCLEGLPLRYLEVDCLKSVNPFILNPLATCAKKLEHLAFFNFYFQKSVIGTNIISECFKGLKKLILSYTRILDEDELCNIACNLLNLEVLILKYCKQGVTNKSVAAIFQNLTQLRELDLSGNNDFDVEALKGTTQRQYAIQRLRRLEKLNLKSCQQLSNDAVLATLKFPFLRSLKFGRGIYTDKGIKVLVRQCPLLEELTITFCPKLGQSALLYIAKSLPRLRLLHFLQCSQVDNSVRLILCAECPLLKDLEISEKRTNANPT